MIREIATRKSSKGYKGLLVILIITIMVIFMSSLIGFAENYYGIKNLEYFVYVMLILFGVFVVRHFITQYRYSLFDDELIIERMLGRRINIIVNVFIWDIVSFSKTDKKPELDNKTIKTHNLYVQQANRYSIIYKKEGELFEGIFSPSQDFIRQLERAIDQRKDKQQRNPDIIT